MVARIIPPWRARGGKDWVKLARGRVRAARGDARRASDIDIALEAPTPLPIELLSEIRDALEESDVLPRVDVVDLTRASAEFRRRVHQEGIERTG